MGSVGRVLRCKEGDLAVVVNSLMDDNNGKHVTCVEFLGKIPGYYHDDWWRVDRSDIVTGRFYGTTRRLIDTSQSNVIRDKSLMPIRPDELKEDEENEEVDSGLHVLDSSLV